MYFSTVHCQPVIQYLPSPILFIPITLQLTYTQPCGSPAGESRKVIHFLSQSNGYQGTVKVLKVSWLPHCMLIHLAKKYSAPTLKVQLYKNSSVWMKVFINDKHDILIFGFQVNKNSKQNVEKIIKIHAHECI